MENQFIAQSREGHVALLEFNSPETANALDKNAWFELKATFEELDEDPDVRAIVLSGRGKHFCAGIDLSLLASIGVLIEDSSFEPSLDYFVTLRLNCLKPIFLIKNVS